jgi:hypothetical protein
MPIFDPVNEDLSGLRVLVYGAPGCGKTDLTASCGEYGYTLAIDIDNGFETFKRKHLAKYMPNIVPYRIEGMDDLDAIYQIAIQNDPGRWEVFFNDPKRNRGQKGTNKIREPFKIIAWDTWSEMQWEMGEKLRVEKLVSTAEEAAHLKYRKNIEIQHWGMLTDINKLALHAFMDLKVVTFCTMHEVMEKDETTGAIYGGPAIHGKMVHEIGKYFGVMGHMYVDLQGKHVVATKTVQRWQAKSRLGDGEIISDPTFCKLIQAKP